MGAPRQRLQPERCEWERYAGEPTAQDALEGAWSREQLGAWSAAFATGQEQRESARAEFPPATQPALC